MLVRTGADLSIQGADGLYDDPVIDPIGACLCSTAVEIVWFKCLVSPGMDQIQALPELQQACEDLNTSVGTDMVLRGDVESLKRHVESHPEAVLVRDCYGLSSLH